ncbi:MAG: patatin-like phospholipase family protein, partial [Rhodothermales bacterium]|nr:patatin-like phospholipase family protein [Rhodothermales bacterium]
MLGGESRKKERYDVRRVGIICLLSMLPLMAARSQEPQVSEPPVRPTVGVALSGGGVKGFAHVGALRVLEDLGLPIDVVTGTSMGS